MPRFGASVGACFLLAVWPAACGGKDDGALSADSDLSAGTAPLGYVGKNVVSTLRASAPLHALEGKTWGVSGGNQLADGWLLPTFGSSWWGDALKNLPTATSCTSDDPACDPDFHMHRCDDGGACPSGTCQPFAPSVTADGQTPKKMCVGYADWFEEAFYDTIVSAERYVDITSLWLPADRFGPAIHNGILRLASRGKPITVRILSGDATDVGPVSFLHTSDALGQVTKDLPTNTLLKVYVSEFSNGVMSWNHSKIIAADGKLAVVGGHNMHTADYQLKDPVSDLSMRLTGPAAAAAHHYANEIWDAACARGTLHGSGMVSLPSGLPCPPHFEADASDGPGGATVISAGRIGAVPDNASDAALLAMVDAAKTRVVMSQEDILGGRIPHTSLAVAPPPYALLDRLAQAMARGVDVYLVISNVDGGLFTTSYSHGWTPAETAQQMADYITKKPEVFPAGTDITGLLCQKMHVAGLRVSNDDRWPDGKVFSNHSKFLMVDDQAFYVGSQNLYVSDLAEFGFIVDSPSAAKTANDTFWAPLWTFSQRTAVTGSEAATCAIRR